MFDNIFYYDWTPTTPAEAFVAPAPSVPSVPSIRRLSPIHSDLNTLVEAASVLRMPPRRLRQLVNDRRIGFVPVGKKKVMIRR